MVENLIIFGNQQKIDIKIFNFSFDKLIITNAAWRGIIIIITEFIIVSYYFKNVTVFIIEHLW